ncbi:MAG: T9SS type A sorting domain-containing protein [Saprospiraceae bacterium]|nr:T9SS type A sorting domain-containing protein [Lewinella sp.]
MQLPSPQRAALHLSFLITLLLSGNRLTAQPVMLDPNFGDHGIISLDIGGFVKIIDLAVLPDEKILVALNDGRIWRFLPDGRIDGSFGEQGKIQLPFDNIFLEDMTLTTDLKMLLTGRIEGSTTSDLLLLRLHPDGTPDETFGENGQIIFGYLPETFEQGQVIIEQPDGKILVGGQISNVHLYEPDRFPILLLRFKEDGTPDPSFGNAGLALPQFDRNGSGISDLKIQADGKILLCGTVIEPISPDEGLPFAALMRCREDGSIDPDFGTDGLTRVNLAMPNDSLLAGGIDQEFQKISLQSDGKIVALGRKFYVTNQAILGWLGPSTYDTYEMVLARFQPEGSPDPTFGIDGLMEGPISIYGPELMSLAIAGQDTLYVGHFSDVTNDQPGDFPDLAVSKYLPDGLPDLSFGQEGTVRIVGEVREVVSNIRLVQDGILFAGHSRTIPGAARQLILGKLLTGHLVLPAIERSDLLLSVQVYPNPFHFDIHLDIQLSNKSPVKIRIINLQGQVLETHSLGTLPAGHYQKNITPDQSLSPGPYFVELQAGTDREYRLLLKVKD